MWIYCVILHISCTISCLCHALNTVMWWTSTNQLLHSLFITHYLPLFHYSSPILFLQLSSPQPVFCYSYGSSFPALIHPLSLSQLSFSPLFPIFYSTSPPSSSSSAHAAKSFSGKRPYSLRNPSTSVAKNSSVKRLVTDRKLPTSSPALYTSRAGRT